MSIFQFQLKIKNIFKKYNKIISIDNFYCHDQTITKTGIV